MVWRICLMYLKPRLEFEVDFDKIANNDEAYMTKYSEAIQKAKEAADDTSVKDWSN